MRTEIHWAESPWPGRLAIMPRPRGGDWLADEVHAWRTAGIDVVASLLTPEEVADLDLAMEAELVQKGGMEFLAFAIEDRSVPPSRKLAGELTAKLSERLAEGKNVAIHCRQGIGRAALIAACLLVLGGLAPQQAFERLSVARGCPVPETAEQRRWVEGYAREQVELAATKN